MKKDAPVLAVLGFTFTGLFSFGLACALLLVRPDGLIGDPAEGWKLAFLHLIILGAVGSLLFAGAYLIGPLLADAPLWSRKLVNIHAHLHIIGLAVMLSGLVLQNENALFVGSAIFFVGLLLLFWNLIKTGAQKTVWTPANMMFQTAMFWLLIGGAIILFYTRLNGILSTEILIDFYAYFILFGFLAQALFGVSLKMLPEALARSRDTGNRTLDTLAWMGWTALNGGLLFFVPITVSGSSHIRLVTEIVIVFAFLCFTLHISASIWKYRHHISWGIITHFTGLVLLLILAALTLYRSPGSSQSIFVESHEWTRLFVSIALLGPVCFIIAGAASLAVPRLIWQLRFQPWEQHANTPSYKTLRKQGANAAVFFSFVIALTYLFLGQWSTNAEAVRLGAVLLLMGFGWFVFYISPAIIRFIIGVTPSDLNLNK